MGMLVMRMLWLMLALSGPKSSDVTDTAVEKINPELNAIRTVEALSAISLPDVVSKQKAIGVGKTAIASHPVLGKYTLLHW